METQVPAFLPTLPTAEILPATSAGAARAAALLQDGKLVVVPTETVYGLALNLASEPARRAAKAIRTRVAEGTAPASFAPWVIHVAQPEDLLAWVPGISALGKRLVTKSLPGPVAFEIKLEETAERAARKRLGAAADEALQDGFLTLRCPEFAATQEMLLRVKSPVAILGAGTRTQPTVIELADVPAVLGEATDGEGDIRGAMDGGPARYRRSSTLVRVEGDRYSVVRPGVIDERIVHRMADLTILFVCSGNTCRSPMAAAIASRQIADRLKISPAELSSRHIVVQSAGVHAGRGQRATAEAMAAAKEYGGDLTAHHSQPATAEGGGLLRRADAVYTMTHAHREDLVSLFPWASRKVTRLDPEGDIDDPIGGPLTAYQRVARRLAAVIPDRLKELGL
jgi:protein-tyrosine-phosphatase/tRNA A37 threonylcarbamoyladenosine synthetase subunit TsaC/SUA5/YrdC